MKNIKLLMIGLFITALALPVNAGEITVGKTEPTGKYHVGETIHYKMYISNPSAVPLRIEKTWDDFALGTAGHIHTEPVPPHTPIFTLAPDGQPGDRVDYDYYEVVTAESVNASNQVTNVFWAEGYNEYPEGEEFAQGQGVETVDILFPCIEVTKEADCDISKVGDKVIYKICIRNCSTAEPPTPLEKVTVVDDVLGDLSDQFPDELTDGEWVCVDIEYEVKPGDDSGEPGAILENTVVASAEDETGYAVSDEASEKVLLIHPKMTVKKECQTKPVPAGGDAEFLVTITNTGDADLDIVTDDPEILPFTLPAGDPPFTQIVKETHTGGDEVCNKIEVTWTLPEKYCGMENTDTISDDDCCPVSEPCIDVTKEVDCDISKVDDVVSYKICIRNCSEPFTELYNVTVVDDVLGDLSDQFPDELLDGEWVCVSDIEYTVKPGDDSGLPGATLENTVEAKAKDEFGKEVSKKASDKVLLIHPKMTVSKKCQTPEIPAGGDAEFLITITNTGDADLEISTDDPEILPFTLLTTDPPFTKTVTRTHTEGDEVCNEIKVTWTLPEKYCGMKNTDTITSGDCCQVVGEEGCTPGFWKNNADKHDASAWCLDTYKPGDDFDTTFGIPTQELRDKGKDVFSDPTLLEALGANGGGINALARHAVAALLNACSDCVDYPMSGAAIIAEVKDAIGDEDAIEKLHIKLAGYNEAGCPVNQQGECVEPEPDADG